jgi:hypothetical protein
MLWCVVLASGFVGMLQQEQPHLCQELERQVLCHDKTFRVPGYGLARGLQAVAIHKAGTAMLNNT